MPTGVSMLPRFAATVCSTTMRMRSCVRSAMPSTTTANGTKVKSATSFVISIAAKKLSSTSSSPIARTLPAFSHSVCARCAKRPACRSPATTVIRQ